MMNLILLFQSSQNRNCFLNSWLPDINRLQPPLQRWIFFYIFSVFINGCRSYHSYFTTSKWRFKNVRSINCLPLRSSSPYKIMDLINKQNYLSVAFLNLFQNRFKSFFKLTSILCTSKQRCHIKLENSFSFEVFRNISFCYLLSKSLNYCCFPNTRITYENWVILCSSHKNFNYSSYFIFTTYHRI